MTGVPTARSDAPLGGTDPDRKLAPDATSAPDDADQGSEIEPLGDGVSVELNLEIEDGDTTLFEAAVGAFHSGEFQRAESLFLEEAQRTIDSAPQRAAISYRQAALAAKRMGNMDASDHWMRLAGREYLRVTEDDRTPLPFIREAAMMAAKCFLSVENLHIASKGLRRAQAIESVLRADDDLMAETSTAPPEPDRPKVDLRVERRATVRPSSATGPGTGVSPSPSNSPGAPATSPLAPNVAGVVPSRSGWFRRFRRSRPARHVA
jgi:hypothetical protein